MLKKITIFIIVLFILFLGINYSYEKNQENKNEFENNALIEKDHKFIDDFFVDKPYELEEINNSVGKIQINRFHNITSDELLLYNRIYDYYIYSNQILLNKPTKNNFLKSIINKYIFNKNPIYFSEKELVDQKKIELSFREKSTNISNNLQLDKDKFENLHFIANDDYFLAWNNDELYALQKNGNKTAIYINDKYIIKVNSNISSWSPTISDAVESVKQENIKLKYSNISLFLKDVDSGKILNDSINKNSGFKINNQQISFLNYTIDLPTKNIGSYTKDLKLFINDSYMFMFDNNYSFNAEKKESNTVEKISYYNMLKMIANDEIKSLNYTNKISEDKNGVASLEVDLMGTNGKLYKSIVFSRNDDNLNNLMLKHNVDVNTENVQSKSFLSSLFGPSTFLGALLRTILIASIFVAIYMLVMNKFIGGSFGKKNRPIYPKEINVSFDDIAGHDEAKKDIEEVLDIAKNKSKYARMNVKPIKGILLYGPPGNGKTMLAKAIAKDCGADFFFVSGSEMIEVYVGVGAKRIRNLFKQARKSKKAVIFIDEIDAVGQKRSNGNNSEHVQTINQLLTLMDGFDSHKYDILVVAATNQLETLDEALLRPGRFDRQIYIGKPSFIGRKEILKVYFDKDKATNKLTDDDFDKMAGLTIDFSGADISNLINEARIIATKKNEEFISLDSVIQARHKILVGNPRADIKLLDDELKRIAYHEVGHTLMILNNSKNNVEQVSITPYGTALGITVQTPDKDNYNYTKQELLNEVYSLLGGRASEQIFLGDISSGASNDIERVYSLMFNLVTRYGMNDNVFKNIGIDIQNYNLLSDYTKHDIEQEIEKEVNRIYKEVIKFLKSHKVIVERMVVELMKKHTLNKDEILEIWEEYTKK